MQNKLIAINHSFTRLVTGDQELINEVMSLLTTEIEGIKFTGEYRAGLCDEYNREFKIYKGTLIVQTGIVELLIAKLAHYNLIYEPLPISSVYTPPTQENFTTLIKELNLPFSPYDYQLKSAWYSLQNKRQINLVSTSGGKTLIIYIILQWLMKQGIKTVMIVPSILLTTQARKDFIEYAENYEKKDEFLNCIHLIGGDNKEIHFDKQLTITTWQSVYDKPSLFKGIEALIVDETHGASSNSLQQISASSTNASIRLGFTGTLQANITDKLKIYGAISSNVQKYITAQTLIDRGLAAPVNINFTFLQYQSYTANQIVSLKYQEELKFLNNHTPRLTTLMKLINKLHTTTNTSNTLKNTLILFDRLELAENIINNMFGEGVIDYVKKPDNEYNTYLINGSTKVADRRSILEKLEVTEGNLLFGTSSILSTGVSVKNLHSLVMINSGKSSVRLIQSIGRLLRKHQSKEGVITQIYDVVDDCSILDNEGIGSNSYSYKHFITRLSIYREAGYPVNSIEVPVDDFE